MTTKKTAAEVERHRRMKAQGCEVASPGASVFEVSAPPKDAAKRFEGPPHDPYRDAALKR